MAQVPAAPPTPQEITRKLSMHASPKKPNLHRPPSHPPLSGTESESELESAQGPLEGNANAPYVASPGQTGDRPLSSIIERRSGDAEEDESDDDDDDAVTGMHRPTVASGSGEQENVVKAGYLHKKGERRKTWKKRWFVLRLAHIAYYKTSKEYQLLRLLDLSDVHSCSPCALKKHIHTFALISPQRTYYLQAASDAEVQDWVRAINDTREAFRATQTQTSIVLPRPPSMAIPIPISPSSGPQAASSVSKGFTATGGSPSDRRSGHVLASSASDSDFDPATSPGIGVTMSPPSGGSESKKSMQDPNKIVLSGYLMKCASKRRNWRKRWFTLTHDRLTIRGSHMDTKHHREIAVSQILDALEVDLPLTARLPGSPSVPPPLPNPSITGASNVSSSSAIGGASGVDAADTDQHVFKIVTAKRTLLLCAPSEEEEIKWLSVIRALIARRSSTTAPASGNVTMGSPGLQASISANPSLKTTGVSPSQPQQYPVGVSGVAPPSEVLTGHALSSSSSSSLAGKSMWRRRSLSNSVSKPPQPGTTLVEEPEHLH